MDFIKNYLTWKHPLKYYNKIENCFVSNFASQTFKGIAMYSVDLDTDFNSEIMNDIYENEAADSCFLVFIGGKYVQILDQVMEKVETISKEIGLHPLGLFISVENNDDLSQFTNYADGADFPLVICKVNNDLWDNLYYKIFTYLQHFVQGVFFSLDSLRGL